MSAEIDLLSNKNIQFLADLKRRDPFYNSYRQTTNELEKLREAYASLISMIKNHHIAIENEDLVLQKAEFIKQLGTP
jgi:hypothetical protein